MLRLHENCFTPTLLVSYPGDLQQQQLPCLSSLVRESIFELMFENVLSESLTMGNIHCNSTLIAKTVAAF